MDMNKQTTAAAENQDLLTDALAKIIQLYKQNKKSVWIALVLIILLGAGISFYSSHCKKITEDSWAAYYTAQLTYLREGQEAGFNRLDAIGVNFKNTPAAQYAQLLKGDILYAQENFAQAAEVYKDLVGASNQTVATVAALSRAAALQAAGDYKTSVDVIQTFIDKNSKSFALPQAYLTLAMSQELAGNKPQAIEAYKHLLENYTKTYFGTLAKDKLSQLQK